MKKIFSSFRCFFLITLCLLIGSAFLSAQAVEQTTADEIEMLLGTGAVTYAQAARFILEASEKNTTKDSQEAFDYAYQQNWLPKNATADAPVKLDKLAFLLMQSFEIKGGIFYSLTKKPHYAYRELIYIGVIQGRTAPSMTVSGERLLFYVNRIFSVMEN